MVSNENGRLQQRERTKLYHILAGRVGVQRHHTQAQTGPHTVREVTQKQPHTQS